MAEDYGFVPNLPESGKPQKAVVKAKSEKESVLEAKTRKMGSTSLGKTTGTPPRGVSPKVWKDLNNSKFNSTIDRGIEAGVFRAERTVGKTPSFSELLPGKGIAKD